MNNCTLIGNLVADVEIKVLTINGTERTKAEGTIGVRRAGRDASAEDPKNVSGFFDFEAWDATAKLLADYTGKGNQVALSGEMIQSRWTQEDGSKRERKVLNVRNVTLIGSKDSGEGKAVAESKGKAKKEVEEDYNPFAE